MVNSTLSNEDLTMEEQTSVSQLRQRMVGLMNHEMYEDLSVFVRFLRARDLNVNAAEAMLKNHLEWRKINQIDTILMDYTPKEVAQKYVTFNTIGVDKEGSPILYFHIGGMDSRGLLKSMRKIDLVKFIVQQLEADVALMKKQSLKMNKHIDKWTMILNFENLSFAVATHKETLEVVGHLITMYESNYPERLKVAYFINSSIYFTMAFAVVKHFLSGPTYKKIKFFGREGWREDLTKLIDSNVLPAFLGGSRTDPDGNPACPSIVTAGGLVPARYHVNRKEIGLAHVPGVEKVTVTRKSKVQLTLSVDQPGCHIEWEFETRSRDIAFSLLYRGDEARPPSELIPRQRIETGVSSETGMLKCDLPGTYIIEFDNSYSWIHQKEVYYKITVVKSPIIK